VAQAEQYRAEIPEKPLVWLVLLQTGRAESRRTTRETMTSNRFIRKERESYRFCSNGSPEGVIQRCGWLEHRGEAVERKRVEVLLIEGEGCLE
jgi:hypothetical protein